MIYYFCIMTIYTRHTLHNHTFCRFQRVPFSFWETIKPNYVSKSGSAYYFTEEGVYRCSNHWGRAANCKWRLEGPKSSTSRTEVGFAKWDSFYPDYPNEALYWVGIDADTASLHYYHKNCPEYNSQPLFTASQMQKIIRKYREYFKKRPLTPTALREAMSRLDS